MNYEQKRLLIFGKKSALITLALLKSFFLAVTQVAWGLVSLFGLNLLLTYIIISQKQVVPELVNNMFITLEGFIMGNIMPFCWVFFILYAFFEIKEVLK